MPIHLPENMPATSGAAVIWVMIACVVMGLGLVWYLVRTSKIESKEIISIFKGLMEAGQETFKAESEAARKAHAATIDKLVSTHTAVTEKQSESFEKALDKLANKIEVRSNDKQSEYIEKALEKIAEKIEGRPK